MRKSEKISEYLKTNGVSEENFNIVFNGIDYKGIKSLKNLGLLKKIIKNNKEKIKENLEIVDEISDNELINIILGKIFNGDADKINSINNKYISELKNRIWDRFRDILSLRETRIYGKNILSDISTEIVNGDIPVMILHNREKILEILKSRKA